MSFFRKARIVIGLSASTACCFLLISLFFTYQELRVISQRIQEDVTFHDGVWDTNAYSADPSMPGTAPVYILAADGYVVERWQPINGFLDASDFKHLLSFSQIQTIRTNSNQEWRIYSVPIKGEGVIDGVITVSIFQPVSSVLAVIDADLSDASKYLLEHVVSKNGTLTLENLDERKIPHYISFQVVSKSNKIVFKRNNNNSVDRLPNFIDPSYVVEQLRAVPIQLAIDRRDGEPFLLLSSPLRTEQVNPIGLIVVGKSVTPILRVVIFYSLLMSLAPLSIIAVRNSLRWRLAQKMKHQKVQISFDKKESAIYIDEKKIPVAYASNQYYVCAAIISHPEKRWEVDELLDKLGEEPGQNSWRVIYDAMNQINKKVASILGKKLIVLEEKTYRYNPELL